MIYSVTWIHVHAYLHSSFHSWCFFFAGTIRHSHCINCIYGQDSECWIYSLSSRSSLHFSCLTSLNRVSIWKKYEFQQNWKASNVYASVFHSQWGFNGFDGLWLLETTCASKSIYKCTLSAYSFFFLFGESHKTLSLGAVSSIGFRIQMFIWNWLQSSVFCILSFVL